MTTDTDPDEFDPIAPKHPRTPAGHSIAGGVAGARERGRSVCVDCADRDSLDTAPIAGATLAPWPGLGCGECGRILAVPTRRTGTD